MEYLQYVIFFFLGYLFNDFRTEKNRKNMVNASNHIFELNSYFVLGELSQMHDLGLKALKLAYEKSLEIDQAQKEEYEKFIDVFDKKMNEFGELYMKNLKKVLTHKIKFNTYKEVKENFHNLFNDSKEILEDQKDA
jgi:hypothetical protein